MATESRTNEASEERIVAFVVYPGLTLLDLVGPLQVLKNLGTPYRTLTVGERVETMPTDTGLGIVPEATFAEMPRPYAIVVPGGGRGTIQAMATPAVQDYLRAADETAAVMA